MFSDGIVSLTELMGHEYTKVRVISALRTLKKEWPNTTALAVSLGMGGRWYIPAFPDRHIDIPGNYSLGHHCKASSRADSPARDQISSIAECCEDPNYNKTFSFDSVFEAMFAYDKSDHMMFTYDSAASFRLKEGWRGLPRRTDRAQGHNSLPPEPVCRRLQFVAEPLESDAATLRLPTSSRQEGWRGLPRRTDRAQGHNSLPPEPVCRRLQFVAEPLESDAATLRLPTSSRQLCDTKKNVTDLLYNIVADDIQYDDIENICGYGEYSRLHTLNRVAAFLGKNYTSPDQGTTCKLLTA
ncbi:hypothetical protein HPB52_002151 [Rhipicephalus sanguineus]|uniref:Uncharacterized protein n=1 Tax=Rhipicephalus sanguineus TaxID=34632 RepID=A0A9D4Q4D0_RHISA|nr:hypothetical protein HPB52_002151 [Rhipicephalus sanguineus]